ncbi:MAG: hypothetical protein AAF628_20470 [Planctomycetota bacterium]
MAESPFQMTRGACGIACLFLGVPAAAQERSSSDPVTLEDRWFAPAGRPDVLYWPAISDYMCAPDLALLYEVLR